VSTFDDQAIPDDQSTFDDQAIPDDQSTFDDSINQSISYQSISIDDYAYQKMRAERKELLRP
jgi:hypothetical protein